MSRRTTVLGVTLLALAVVAAPAVATEADAKSSDSTTTSKSSSGKSKKDAVPTFTNADIAALPAAGNSEGSETVAPRKERPAFSNADLDALPAIGNEDLPPLEDDADAGGSPNRFVIIGTPATEGEAEAPPVEFDAEAAAESMRWVEEMLAERDHAARIAAAQRRVQRAERRVEEVERTFRPKGSAFSEGRNTDELFMRGVASTSSRYDDSIRQAYTELAAARAALDTLLANAAARRAGTTGGAS